MSAFGGKADITPSSGLPVCRFDPLRCQPLGVGDPMRRREFITVFGGAMAWPLVARAQQTMPIIGFLSSQSEAAVAHLLGEFQRSLTEFGFEDRKTVGLVTSLNRPGGNATGVNLFLAEIESKRIGLLHELTPAAAKIAMLVNPRTVNAEAQIGDIRAATSALGLPLEVLNASNDVDIEVAFERLKQLKMVSLIVEAD